MSCGSIICYQKESKIVFPLNELCASTLAGANWPLHNFFLTKKHHHPQGQGSGGVPRLHWGPITQSCTLCDSSDYFLWLTVVLFVEHWQKSLILHIFTKKLHFQEECQCCSDVHLAILCCKMIENQFFFYFCI